MVQLPLGELIGPCSRDLELQIKGAIVFRCHLSESTLDFSCQMVSISKLCLGLSVGYLPKKGTVCLSAIGHACTGLVDCDRYLCGFISWLMICCRMLLAGERCDQCFIGVDLDL